jgi:hypothetical protein
MKFSPYLGNSLYLSLVKLWMIFVYWRKRLGAIYWILVFLVIWWNILDKEGFFVLSLGIGKEFLHNCVVSSCFKVNLSKSLEEYKGIHPPSISI